MTLKTLKDREKQWMNSNIEQSKKDILFQFNHELKQEAIKWVKEDKEDALKLHEDYLVPWLELINRWMNRFNITEEDLK